MKTVRRALSIIASVALLAGCALIGPEPGADTRVVYRIAASYRGEALPSSRTVVPGVPTIASYTLWGARDAAPLDELLSFANPSGAEIALETGTWTFRLEAKNGGAAVLLEETQADLVIGTTPGTLSFDLKPLESGTGSVHIDISWPSGLPALPAAVETKITGFSPVIAPYILNPALSISGDSVVFDRSDFAAGRYLIVFLIRDGSGELLTTVSELVRVAPRLTSAAGYALAAGDFSAPPASPTDLAASYGSMSVGLVWTDASNTETGFELERSADSGSTWTLLASNGSGAVNHSDTAVVRGAAYVYRVRSANSFGASSWATSAQIIVPYLLSFDSQGGSAVNSVEFIAGAATTLPIAPTRTGFTFNGWNTLSDGNGTNYSASAVYAMPAVDTTLYAQWTAKSYDVVFDANGGTGTMSAQTVVFGDTVSLSVNAFTRTGHSFAGWNAMPDGTGTPYADGANYVLAVASSVTLYARWTANNYAIAFASNGSTGSMPNQSFAYNATAALTANSFTRTGYTFSSWNTAVGGGGAFYADGASYTMLSTSTVTIYAQWTANSNAVVFAANGGSGSMASQSIVYDATAALAANAFTRTGYSFTGWNTIAGSGGTAYADGANYTMLSTTTVMLYAQWMANSNVVNFDANGGTGTMGNQTIATNATEALFTNAFIRTGYSFAGWNTAANGAGTQYADGADYTMGSTSIILYARWTADNYAITFAANGGSGSMSNQSIAYGATAALTANAFTRTGYSFAGWNAAAGGGGAAYADGAGYTMLSTSTVTLYAQWAPISTINISISIGNGDLITITGPTTIAQGATLNVAVTQAFTAYDWYLDGEGLASTSQNIELPTGSLDLGIHTLMVVATNGTGARSSAMYRFTVTN